MCGARQMVATLHRMGERKGHKVVPQFGSHCHEPLAFEVKPTILDESRLCAAADRIEMLARKLVSDWYRHWRFKFWVLYGRGLRLPIQRRQKNCGEIIACFEQEIS